MWRQLLSSIIIFLIIKTSNSVVIECQWRGDLCISIISMTPVTQPNEAVTIIGKPANYINTETTYLSLLDCVLNYLPPGIFTVFPNLVALSINNCQATTLAANPNLNCGHLETFFIANGIISNIPEGFVETCSQLTVLNLGSNRIETIDKNAFKGLTKMTNLDMSFNNLTCIPVDLFQNLPLIRSIFISNNKIKTINSGTFRNVISLMFVNFADNPLQYLPTFDLNGTSSQIPLYISFENNPIYAISPDFTSIYQKRASLAGFEFILTKVRCLANDEYFTVSNTNFMNTDPYLQKCYQNWTSSMTGNVGCGQGSVPVITAAPLCPIDSFWQKLLDYLTSLKLV